MKRKILSLLLALALIITAIPFSGIELTADAAIAAGKYVSGETDEWYYTTSYNQYDEYGGLKIYCYKGNQKNVVIPSEINGIPVTAVGSMWTDIEHSDRTPYYDTSNVETVVVPETVKYLIGSFANLTNLKSVTLSEGLEVIGNNTFENCTQLTEIDIPDSVIKIYGLAFKNSGIEKRPFEISFEEIEYDFSKLSEINEEIIFNSQQIEFKNLRHAKANKIICNGMIYYFQYYGDNPGVVDNKNLEIVCNGGLYSELHLEYTKERGLYAHLDDETGVLTYNCVPVEEKTEYISGDYRYYLNSDNEAVISRYLGKDSEVTVPETIDGHTVSEIGTLAFAGGIFEDEYFDFIIDKDQITSVVLPETVKKIGAFAFEYNTSLVSVDLPDAVEVIPSSAFERCHSLENVDWPANLKAIGPMAFYGCKGLTDIQLPEGLVRIGSNAIANCKNLKSVSLPETLESIGYYAFYEDSKLESISIPDSVTELGDGAFMYCEALEEAKLPADIEVIPENLFWGTNLNGIDIPETVIKIEHGAFCSANLGAVELPENLEYIGNWAFSGANLETVELPENLKYIGHEAFWSVGLTELNLPDSVEYVGEAAFGSNNFETLVLDWQNIYAVETYAFSYCENLKRVEIAGEIKEIRSGAFSYCDKLEEIIIGDSVTRIYNRAFQNDTSLESVTIPENIKFIGFSAFGGCSELKTFNFNAVNCVTIAKQGADIFAGCAITDLNIGEKVEIINDDLFSNIRTLVNVEFSGNLKSIGNNAFSGCTALQNIDIPDSVKSIGKKAFSKCSSLVYADLSENLKDLGASAFSGCKSLESIVLPDGLETIGSSAFAGCAALTEITIPEKIKELDSTVFDNCSSLKTIYLNTLDCTFTGLRDTEHAEIKYSPFYYCESLEEIVLLEGIEAIPDYFFCGLKSISVVDIPASVTSIGKAAFAYSSVTELTGCEGVEKIGEYCFYKTESFGEFVLPEKVTDISPYTFADSGITGFVASDNLESILESAFEGCSNLENVDLKNNVMIIDNNTFAGCGSLKNLTVPDSVKNIGNSAFADCGALEIVYMSTNISFIPTECFCNDSALSSFTWNPESKLIGRMAFGNCSSLNSFDFNNVEKLYDNSFSGSGITAVMLGEKADETHTALEEIEVQSFMECMSLASVSIGGNVSTIKSQAFADCENLETAVISDTVTDIATDAFDGCDNLTIYCSEDSYAHSYAESQGIDVTTFVIAPIPEQTYTGNEIKPEISVTFSGEALKENEDFTVTYSDNVNVGKAVVSVKGLGELKLLERSVEFTILAKGIDTAEIATVGVQNYTGKEVKPEIIVTDGANVLREGTDYTVTYSDNVEPGTATAVITGKGNYSGTKAVEYEIEELNSVQIILNSILSFFNSVWRKITEFFSQLIITRNK